MPIIYETLRSGIHVWKREKIGVVCQHVHEYVEVIYLTQGELCFYMNFKKHLLRAGDAVFVFPGQIHSHEESSDDCQSYTLFFPKSLPVYDTAFAECLPDHPVIHIGNDEQSLGWFREAVAANGDRSSPYSKGVVVGYISLILGKYLPLMSLHPFERSEFQTERKLIEYCSTHYKERITLDSLSDALSYSTTYISRLFSEKFKIGFTKFISTIRTEEAKKMLRGDSKMANIAFESGFGSIRNFNRIFKEQTGLSPTEYREQTKKR